MSYPNPPVQVLPASRCYNHPDREGVGICVGCRAVVCVECTTRIDRMNYCIRCLQGATGPVRETVRDEPAGDRAIGIPLLVASVVTTAALFALMGLLLAALRHGGGISGG